MEEKLKKLRLIVIQLKHLEAEKGWKFQRNIPVSVGC